MLVYRSPPRHGIQCPNRIRKGVTMTTPTNVTIAGGMRGSWRVTRMSQVTGDGLALVDRLTVIEGVQRAPSAPK